MMSPRNIQFKAKKRMLGCNIGTDTNPKIIKLSKALSEDKRSVYVNLMKEFVDIFAWSYENLNIFDT
jgi:hypothetical protein